jgi:hypothetical protein
LEKSSADVGNSLNQLYEGMTFLYGGLTAGVLYELFAIIHRHSNRRWLLTLLDVLYVLYSSLCIAVSFLIATGGVLRLHGFLLLLLGWLLARWAFQPLFHML